jgi:hypothetical protein
MSTSTPSIPTAANGSAPKSNLPQLLSDVGLSPEDLGRWLEDLRQVLQKIRGNPDQDAGFTEESIRQHCRELELLPTLTEAQAKKVNTTVEYYTNNLPRMKYTEADHAMSRSGPVRSNRRADNSNAG